MLLRETFEAGPLQCNCTVLACPTSRAALVIDPGGAVTRIAEIIAAHDLTVAAIIHTHAHIDHIYCTSDVKQAHGGDICLHKDDLGLYKGLNMQAAMLGLAPTDTLPVERFVEHGDVIEFGEQSLAVIHTPGHTPGSVCFELDDGEKRIVFAGDTLFRRSIGRTDLPGGDPALIAQSIRERLYTMTPEALVIPGHGPNTTIGEEAERNPFVTAK